jgi:2-dehydro-3-deoxygalactonokinase
VLAESRGAEGMLVAAETGFETVLAKHLSAVSAPPSLPVIICGMAGARGGWVEAGYIDTPAPLASIASGARAVAGQGRDIRILPGLAQRDLTHPDVMRGEETQLLGAVGSFRNPKGMVCMPGTHSKWVSVDAGTVRGFSTYMTGELFDVITHHSILKQAIADGGALSADNPVFGLAVRTMAAHPGSLTRLLFGARSGQILHGLSPTDATAHISGALIGAEIAGAMADVGAETGIVLVATGRLQALYEAAFAALDLKSTTIDADSAVLKGLATAAHALWPQQP